MLKWVYPITHFDPSKALNKVTQSIDIMKLQLSGRSCRCLPFFINFLIPFPPFRCPQCVSQNSRRRNKFTFGIEILTIFIVHTRESDGLLVAPLSMLPSSKVFIRKLLATLHQQPTVGTVENEWNSMFFVFGFLALLNLDYDSSTIQYKGPPLQQGSRVVNLLCSISRPGNYKVSHKASYVAKCNLKSAA